MKPILFVVFFSLSTTFLFAQSENINEALCDSLIKVEADSVAGVYNIGSRNNVIISKDGKKVLEFVFLVIDKTIILNISIIGDTYCVDETNKININFKGGTSLELPNNGKFNCDGEFSLFFSGGYGKKKELLMFQTEQIESVKVGIRKSAVYKDRKNYIEASIPTDKSKVIMQTMLCIAAY